jgi:hypothetical protein
VRISSLLACRGQSVSAAGRALGILADLDRVEAGAQRVVDQERAVEALAEPNSSFSTSTACKVPSTPAMAPRMPAVSQRDTSQRLRPRSTCFVMRARNAHIGPIARNRPWGAGG